MNAKNSFGAYTGVKTTAFGFRNQKVEALSVNPAARCANVKWEPFTELMAHDSGRPSQVNPL